MKTRIASILCITMLFLCLTGITVPAEEKTLDERIEKNSASDLSEEGPYTAKQLYNMTAPKVVEILTYDVTGEPFSRGSGFFIDNKGTIVTNYHVIEDSCAATVQTASGEIYDVNLVIGYDKAIDLAILKIDLAGNEYLRMPSFKPETGDTIYTLGSSLGLTGTFSDGMISTGSRIIDGIDYIQITAPISHGNSGGPLINHLGEVIGVNTWFYVDGQNVNFAVNIRELGKLDISSPVTMEQFYAQTTNTQENQSVAGDDADPDIASWYAHADRQEIESNDSFDWSDTMRNGYVMAGNIEGIDDFDYFNIKVVAPTELRVWMVPMYIDDNDYLIVAVVDEEQNILAYADPREVEDDSVEQYLALQLDAPGTYYLVLCVSDDYPYSDASYYQLLADW